MSLLPFLIAARTLTTSWFDLRHWLLAVQRSWPLSGFSRRAAPRNAYPLAVIRRNIGSGQVNQVKSSDIPVCEPSIAAVRKPAITLPPLACDCHAHICGPASRYAYYEQRVYTPTDCLLPDYRAMLTVLGVERAVLVQPSFYAADNTVLLGALKDGGENFRGVAVVTNNIADAELQRMHDAGVRGVRVNVVDTREAKGVLPMTQLGELASRVKPFGWHMEFLAHVNEFPDLDRLFAGFPVDVVFGHLGYVPTGAGTEAPGFGVTGSAATCVLVARSTASRLGVICPSGVMPAFA
jgi:hypothetical protein